MHAIAQWVTFIKNPFRRIRSVRKSSKSNEDNLDIVQSLIGDSGCEVFIADLWARCLSSRDPSDEEEALFRQQSMLEEMGVHGILVHQQRHKDIEMRSDKRPTREGIKGSGAYVETADTMLGVHRPAQWRPQLDDNKLEVIVLKRRYGRWPIAIEFDWCPDEAQISGGRTIDYDPVGDASASGLDNAFIKPESHEGGYRRGRKR
jgi:hypothetical protein